jgi:hypothetical protein
MRICIDSNSGDLKMESRRFSVNLLFGVEAIVLCNQDGRYDIKNKTYSNLESKSISWVS